MEAMTRQINRAAPRLAAAEMKTYQIAAPVQTHFRLARCSEVECRAFREGWRTLVDISTALGAAQARYIRAKSGRAFTVERTPMSTAFTFVFPPGQRCFAQHQVPLERPAIFVVREGDWRGNPRHVEPRILKAPDWVDDFATHQDKLIKVLERG